MSHKQDRLKYYRRFTDSRNKYLEVILDKYRVVIADQLRVTFHLMAQVYLSGHNHNAKQLLSYQIKHTAMIIEHLIKQMRSNIYKLTVTSEGEVLSRITDKRNHHTSLHNLHKSVHKDLAAGGSIASRVEYYINGIDRKLAALAELAAVKGEKLHPVEIQSAFPKLKKLPRKVELKRLTEADDQADQKLNLTTDTVTDQEWNDILSDYQDEYIPVNRGPEAVSSDEEMMSQGRLPSGLYEDATYDWELEQDLTHDFVQSVRDGQNDAANENGIVDMAWLAVLGKHTCESCIWRDGKTSTEIEEALKGEHKDDDWDAIVAPAHFNCFCSSEPVTDNLPDAPMSNKDDFDSWLNS